MFKSTTKKEIADELKAQTGDKVSSKTIQRNLKEKRLAWRKKSKKPYVSEKNRVLRLSFAREHVSMEVFFTILSSKPTQYG